MFEVKDMKELIVLNLKTLLSLELMAEMGRKSVNIKSA